MRKIKDAEVRGKRVLVRADLNVPLKNGQVADDWRLQALVPTLELLAAQGAQKITVLTHLGRPGGTVVEELRVAPVERRLRELTKAPFELRENLRFDAREEKNDATFAKELAELGDLYVNEAFPVSHRNDTSIVGVPKLLPSYAGLRFIEEVEHIEEAVTPAHPALALIGGAKFETKEPLLQKLGLIYEQVLVGGALGNNLLKSRGFPVGDSLVAEAIAPTDLAGNARLVAPSDVSVVSGAGEPRPTNTADVRAQEKIVDIGPKTAEIWTKEIENAKFVLWNGPMGLYEKGHTEGTDVLAAALARSSCRALIGGGDTVAAIRKVSFDRQKVFLSTGGGAMLELLTRGTLPALEFLRD